MPQSRLEEDCCRRMAVLNLDWGGTCLIHRYLLDTIHSVDITGGRILGYLGLRDLLIEVRI
jgi:hypothetical protein